LRADNNPEIRKARVDHLRDHLARISQRLADAAEAGQDATVDLLAEVQRHIVDTLRDLGADAAEEQEPADLALPLTGAHMADEVVQTSNVESDARDDSSELRRRRRGARRHPQDAPPPGPPGPRDRQRPRWSQEYIDDFQSARSPQKERHFHLRAAARHLEMGGFGELAEQVRDSGRRAGGPHRDRRPDLPGLHESIERRFGNALRRGKEIIDEQREEIAEIGEQFEEEMEELGERVDDLEEQMERLGKRAHQPGRPRDVEHAEHRHDVQHRPRQIEQRFDETIRRFNDLLQGRAERETEQQRESVNERSVELEQALREVREQLKRKEEQLREVRQDAERQRQLAEQIRHEADDVRQRLQKELEEVRQRAADRDRRSSDDEAAADPGETSS
jgi:hypothetical protein